MKKKTLAILLSLAMVLSLFPVSAFASGTTSGFSDMPSNWSTKALENVINNGLLVGDNGKIMPNANLTRAQMATVVNRAFGTTEKESLSSYTDVAANAWYYDDMAKAVQMKTFVGSGDKLNPNNNITREETFAVLARVFKLSGADQSALDKFSDKALVSSWAEDGVTSLVAAGYVVGSNSQLNPKKYITRAEFAQIMDNLLKNYIKTAGTYTTDYAGNVMINVPGVTLKNIKITGDLIIGDGVGNGDVTLDGITVTGKTTIRGGGVNSIKIIGNTNLQNIIIARVDGEIRVYAKDGTQIGEVIVDGSDNVTIEGNFGTVTVTAPDITVTATNADIESATINGENSKVIVSENSKIANVIVNGQGVDISGDGEINKVEVNANDITVKTIGTMVTAADGTTGVMAGSVSVNSGNTETVPGPSTSSSHSSSASEQINPEDYFTFDISTGAITDYDVAGGLDVVIPATIKGVTVTAIGDNAFRADEEEVVDADKLSPKFGFVLLAGKQEYTYENQITSISIPDSVESIGRLAFYHSNIINIDLPSNLTSIGSSAFSHCAELTSLTILDKVTSIGNYAFSNCGKLKNITIPDGVTKIEQATFESCTELTSVVMLGSVYSIEPAAFYGCESLINITIPDTVTSIGNSAFSECSGLTSIIIPNLVVNMGNYTFAGCTGLERIILSENMISIGGRVFYNCESLTNITIPEKVTAIAYEAFENCTGLRNVTVSDVINTSLIGSTSLINLQSTVNFKIAYDGNGAGTYTRTLEDDWTYPTAEEYFTFDSNTGTITDYNFEGGLDVIIPATIDGVAVITIGDDAFRTDWDGNIKEYVNPLTSVLIPDSVTSIGERAFLFSHITKIDISDNVTKIGAKAFYECRELTSIVIPSKSDTIHESTFEYCTSLASVTIPEGVKSIEDHAFARCNSLTNITIPNSVEIFESSIFFECEGLTDVTLGNQIEGILYNTFYNCVNLTNINMPASIKSIGRSSFNNCTSLTNIIIPDGVTIIDEYAFVECTSLTSISIPENVTSIGISAFENCTGLTSISIPSKVVSIGDKALRGSTGLTSIIMENSTTAIGNSLIDGNNYFKAAYEAGGAGTYIGASAGEWTKVLSEEDIAFALAEAKIAAHTALTTAVGTYTAANYTTGNWTILTGFRTTGDTAIDAATDLTGVDSAKTTAINGMVGVAKILVITGKEIAGITAPVTGATPVTIATATDEYTATVTWSSAPAKFAVNTVYTASIIITPKTGYKLTGVSANFFKVAGATATNSINSGVVAAVFSETVPIQLTISDPTLTTTKVYNGTTTAAVTAGALSGIISGDTVTVTAVATYNTVAVGTGKTITVVYTLGGTDAGNYTKPVTYTTTTGAITTATITAIGAISGTAQVGTELTAGALTLGGATASYQWTIATTSGGTYIDISGATENKYTPVAADASKFIKVTATGTGNYSGTATSVATSAVANEEQAAPSGLAGVAPTTYGGTDGKITGTTTAMEYKLSTATDYITAAATATAGLAAGTYQVRYAAKTGFNAGATVDVVVAAWAIGQSYQGGTIAYILQFGDPGYVSGETHGLIAATEDQSAGIIWAVTAYQSTTVPGATGTTIGTGLANTIAIVTQNEAGSTYAAGLCDAYTNNDTGTGIYNDWYLPSKNELNHLYLNKDEVGGFANGYYLSSTEADPSNAWVQTFNNGSQFLYGKSYTKYVRAVRAF